MNTQNTINTSYIPPYLIDCINNKDIESIDIEKKTSGIYSYEYRF